MRNRQIYELTQTRSRRRSSIDTEFDSHSGYPLNTSQINQKGRSNYFSEIDNENASFSHNMIISRQVQYRCLNGDYIQICDSCLQIKNQDILSSQINNQNQISLFINLKIDDSNDLMGLWISKDIAQTYTTDVMLLECYISKDINQKSIKLVQYSILLADELFITCQTIQIFNTFLGLLSVIKIKVNKITIAELDKNIIDNYQLEQLHQFCQFVQFTDIFPSKIIDFQWQYYDYKQNNCKFVPIKTWREYHITSKCLHQIIKQFAEFVQNYEVLNDNIVDTIYSKVFESIIDSSIEEFKQVYENSIQINLIPILPNDNFYNLLVFERCKIQENLLEEMVMFKNFSYFKLRLYQFMLHIDTRESELITFNKEIFECYESQKLSNFLNEVYYSKIYSNNMTPQNIQSEIENIFTKLFMMFQNHTDHLNYLQLQQFFDKTYKIFFTDMLDKSVSIMEKEYNKEFCNFIELIEYLHHQIELIEEKAIYLAEYNEIVKKEIQNLQKIINNMTHLNQMLEPAYNESKEAQTQLQLLEIKQFQQKMLIQKNMQKMIKKEQKKKKKK